MRRIVLLFALILSSYGFSQVQLFWRGDSGLDGNWNASTRWWNGSSAQAADFGQLNFTNNAYLAATCNGSFNTWRIIVESGASTTRTTTGTGVVTFYDFSGAEPVIRNNSSVNHNFNQNFSVGNTSGATRFDRRLELIAANGDLSFGGTFSTANVSNVTRSLRLDASSSRSLTLSGQITEVNSSNALVVQKIGAGTANLSGNNNYSLGVVMDAGVLRAGSNTAFGSGVFEFYGGVVSSTSGSGRTFANNFFIGGSATFGQSSGGTGDLAINGTVNLAGGTRTITIANTTTTFSGEVFNGGLTKAGSGTLVLSGATTYAGATSVTGGQLSVLKSGYSALITTSGLQVTFDAPPSLGNYVILPGALSSASTLSTLGLGEGRTATFNASTGVLTVSETPSVSLSSDDADNSFCEGTTVTFTATASSVGGGTVSYDFKVDGVTAQSGASNVFVTDALTDGQEVQVVITVSGGFVTSTTASSTVIVHEVIALSTWYLDSDGDGYYTGEPIVACVSPGSGYVTTVIGGNDCNDSNAAVNPGATEICFDGIDNNCNGSLYDGCTPVITTMEAVHQNQVLPNFRTTLRAIVPSYS
ncbi:MAG: MopE-related protein, partial [Flavobacterium sp.]|nr:MopE-related protein [Flavobacterium sp.]